MTVKVVDTSSWLPFQLDPYWPDIFAALLKLKAKCPEQVSISYLIAQWASGKRKLWLVLDEADKFMAFAMTEVELNLATGRKFVTLKDMAGEGVIQAKDEICAALEAYAKSEGITDMFIQGLEPWKRVTKQHGYAVQTVFLKKTTA